MSSPTKPTTSIDDLPWEMIRELFKHIGPEDLIACSQVNKRWHAIYADFKLHRLVVSDYDRYHYLVKWISSNRPIQEAERCHPAIFRRLAAKPLLSNLQHLAVTGPFEFDLNQLNRFSRLVHLEINLPSSSLGADVHLNLPRLRVLAFHYFNYSCALSVDCPELNTLEYYAETRHSHLLKVKHPETIRMLKTCMTGRELDPFKSVECLVTNQFEAISQDTLRTLSRLRELRYDRDIECLVEHEFNYEVGTIDHVKRTLSEFVEETKKLRGSDFRFTFSGFHLTNVNVDLIDFGAEVFEDEKEDEEDETHESEYVCNEYIYMKNYHLIEPGALQFIQRVHYSSLLSCVNGEFPRCFSQKFTGIEEVQIRDVVKDEAHLLWFLKSLRFLKRLELYNAELSQEFYDQLPAVGRSLISLEVEGDWKDELQLNFDFVGEFSSILTIGISQPLSLSSATSLVRWLGRLKQGSIHTRSRRDLWVEKGRDSTLLKITDLYRTLFETEDPNEIINFLQR